MKLLLFIVSLLLIIDACLGQVDLNGLDGSITNTESMTLTPIGTNQENTLLLDSSSKDYLKVTVKSEKLYVASLCICTEKGEIIVLHASSALGDLTYSPNANNLWYTEDKFNWELRESEMSKEAINKRNQYLKKHGWVANTMSMGNAGETEFIIDRTFLGWQNIYLAIGLMAEADPEQIVGIPINTAGDCAALSLVSGDPIPNYSFNPLSWIRIQ